MTHIQLTLIAALASLVLPALGSAVSQANPDQVKEKLIAYLEDQTHKLVSGYDIQDMQFIKRQIDEEYESFKSIENVLEFLEKVRTLVQKHPKNSAFAQGQLKELHKFLSQEIVARLARVDTEPFVLPLNDEFQIHKARKAIEEDELTKKLFSGPLHVLIETRKQQFSRSEEGNNHRDGNFFTNFWCKLSGSCPT